MMGAAMVSIARAHGKISDCVVALVEVDVMHPFNVRKASAKMLFDDVSVLRNPSCAAVLFNPGDFVAPVVFK